MMKIFFIFCLFFNMMIVFGNEEVVFNKCVDGDTFKVEIGGNIQTVRLLAVDTPETVKKGYEIEYYGKEASDFTCKMVSEASKIELEYDDNSDKTDKYGRILAWVFVDGHLLQKLLIEGGYAEIAYLYGDYKYTPLLQDKQAIAESLNKGIWDLEGKANWNKENVSDEEENKDFTVKDILIIIVVLVLIYFIKGISKKLNKYKKKVLKI